MKQEAQKHQYAITEIEDIPKKWEICKLNEITKKTEQLDPRKLTGGHFQYIDVSSISNRTLRIEAIKDLDSKQAPSRARKIIKAGDVLFATVRPSLRRVALVPPTLDGQRCSTALCVIRCDPTKAFPQFIYYSTITERFIQQVSKLQRGVSYPAVTIKDVLNQQILLPPLEEQKRIIAVLSAVQNSFYRTISVIQETRLLKTSIMKYLFTYGTIPITQTNNLKLRKSEIGKIPEEWSVLPFIKCIKKKPKPIKTVKQGFYQEQGTYPIIDQGKSLIVGYWDQEEDVWQSPLPVIIFGDHTREIKFIDFPFVCGAEGTKVILPDTTLFEPLFFYYALLNLRIPNRGYNRHYSLLKKKKISCPPLREQKKIINVLSTIDKKIIAELNKKQALEILLDTLLHELLSGKIRMN